MRFLDNKMADDVNKQHFTNVNFDKNLNWNQTNYNF
jgi:hypothetical protein